MVGRSERVLIVDDFPMMRKALRDALIKIGFSDFTDAVDGSDAFQKLTDGVASKRPFGLVFLDWNMPKMTGIELVEQCRLLPQFAELPIIMISAERDRANVIRALKAGANDYILKPFMLDPLAEKVDRILTAKPKQKAAGE